jgi:hypothetical protein
MSYILKEESSNEFKKKYRNQYISDTAGISKTYTSLILNRKRACPKRIAYAITKVLDKDAELYDFFEVAE